MQPTTTPHSMKSQPITSTCPLCERPVTSFIADHRGLPRHQLRNGYSCECAGRFTVPVEEDFLLRQKAKEHREVVAKAVRQEWSRGVTVNLDKETFRRLLLAENGA
jgi:hypothetical protein